METDRHMMRGAADVRWRHKGEEPPCRPRGAAKERQMLRGPLVAVGIGLLSVTGVLAAAARGNTPSATATAQKVSTVPGHAVCHVAGPGQPAVADPESGQAQFVDGDGEGGDYRGRGEGEGRGRHRHRRHRRGGGGDGELPPGFQEPPPGVHKPPGHPTGDCTVCHGPNAIP
jgi:hypothetical protein